MTTDRTCRKRIIVFAAAIIMAFTVYGGLGTGTALSLDKAQQDIAAAADPAHVGGRAAPQEGTGDQDGTDPAGVGAGAADDTGIDAASTEGTDAAAEDPGKPASIPSGVLQIERVQVLTSPRIQAIYRPSVYQGLAANGEDPEKWYTTETTINLRDPRVFTLGFSVPAKAVGKDPKAYLKKVKLQYGGYDLSKWGYNKKSDKGHRNDLRGKHPIFKITGRTIEANADGGYNVHLDLRTENPWSPRIWGANIPYPDYGGGSQLDQFSDGQSADNRWYWQIGPAHKGLGTYDMTALAGKKKVASAAMEIQQYDGSYSWIQMNEFAQSLVAAINGKEIPKTDLAKQVTGTIAKGYVGRDEAGNFIAGDPAKDVWVEVSILGYGLTDNDKKENRGYNNYARYNAIWNIVVAQDEGKVDTYLNETKPAMNEHPEKLINQYKNAKPGSIDMLNVCYLNNVHPDEISGIDSDIRLITDLIDGGREGKRIDYYSWTDADMEFAYRDPAEGYEESDEGHQVRGGYDGIFKEQQARQNKTFDTKEALDSFIFVTNICSNPDAKAGMRRTNRYNIDLNRDLVFSTMPETLALSRDVMKWDPLLLLEWHGYVQEMLIEPCTAPHDPAYDYDLLANNMQNLTYAAGEAVTANTGYDQFLIPWDHYDAGEWDDGGTVYAPMFSELLGCFGYTIEFPDANSDSYDAGRVIVYAMIDELLHGTCDFYAGNRLNGPLKDVSGRMRDSHAVDIIDKSMRKNSVLSKLETKKRGIENTDSMAADKYFIDKKPVLDKEGNKVPTGGTDWYGNPVYEMDDVVVGRARPKDASGKTLSFYPDYIVIPYGEGQYNFAEGIKGINQMLYWGIRVEQTTEDVKYNGQTIRKGSYVLPMNQANRNVIFEVMSKGYDATGFSGMYADIYCNLPDVRGFDSVQVYGKGLFDGKTKLQTETITKVADISGDSGDYVAFKSQSTDAVRFVNHLLKNRADVWMMTKTVDGVAAASDYIIRQDDLQLLSSLPDKPVLGIVGCQIEGQRIETLPQEAQKLVDPVIQYNTKRTAQTGGPLWYLLDDYLGFNSMADYNGSTELRQGANVILACNLYFDSDLRRSWVDAIKSGQAGLIVIGNTAGLDRLGIERPRAIPAFGDVALNGTYNEDGSLFATNYEETSTYYARGFCYEDLPEGSKVLFRSLKDGNDAFIGGFQATDGDKEIFGDRITMFSTVLADESYTRANQLVVFGQFMDNRTHYQKLLPMLATAIYASAAGIVDDTDMPAKKANTLIAKGRTVKVSAAKLKRSKQTIKRTKAITIKDPQGPLTYRKVGVSKKAYSGKFTVNARTGKITVARGVKKGTYRLKVKVTAAGNAVYEPKTETVTVTIRVR